MNDPTPPAPETQESSTGEPNSGKAPREAARKRQRPAKTLPTERVSFQKQRDALRAYASTHDITKAPVTNAEVGKIIQLNATTTGLMNSFFVETGLLQRVEGGFLPSEEVKAYELASQWDEPFPGRRLKPILAEAWFAQALLPPLRVGPKDEREAISILATAANAEPSYRPHLQVLLEWLELGGLIEREGGVVRAAPPERDAPPPPKPENAARDTPPPPANAPGTSRTVKLSSGGTLTISATLDLFALSQVDRTFVFGLIDKLEEYEANLKKAEPVKEGG